MEHPFLQSPGFLNLVIMHHNKTIIRLLILFLFLVSCIEKFSPDISTEDSDLYVIQGEITNVDGFKSIYISKSSPIENPQKIPVSDCIVKIYDDNDNTFQAEEFTNGEYKVYIDQSFLSVGTAFKLEILTSDGQIITSDYDTLRDSPEIDSIYYQIEQFPDENSDFNIPTVQFYIDFNGTATNTHNVKFEIEETWEYQVEYPIQWTWDGYLITKIDPPDYSKKICWKTEKLSKIYLLSTEKFNENKYFKFPLHTIPNTSVKALNGYSLLIKQYSLSNSTNVYFQKISSNIINDGGLYETQPQQIEGNMHNITNPGNRILGYFSVSSVTSKRVFYANFGNLLVIPPDFCDPMEVNLGLMLKPKGEPIHLLLDGKTYRLFEGCYDCTSLGGVTTKPDFWPL